MIDQRHDYSSVSKLRVHITLTPKYRKKIFQSHVKTECENSIRATCEILQIDIISLSVQPDHIHMFIQHPPKLSISKIVELIKTKSSRHLRMEFPHLKRWCKKALWSRGFHVTSVGHGEDAVINYIQNQGDHGVAGSLAKVAPMRNTSAQPALTNPEGGS